MSLLYLFMHGCGRSRFIPMLCCLLVSSICNIVYYEFVLRHGAFTIPYIYMYDARYLIICSDKNWFELLSLFTYKAQVVIDLQNIHKAEIEKVIEIMKHRMDEELTSEQLAAEIGYSPFHFNRIFKQVTGVSPRRYLSALRMEQGKVELLSTQKSLLQIILSLGYRSIGTYTTRFSHSVGLSPKSFPAQVKTLMGLMDLHRNSYEQPSVAVSSVSELSCHITAPDTFHGMIFVGLFPRPIPDQRPVIGTARNHKGVFRLTNIPNGTYYLLAAGIPWSLNPRDYFILDRSLRGKYPEAVHISEGTNLSLSLLLREPLATDPPIVINLPQLLYEQTTQYSNLEEKEPHFTKYNTDEEHY